MSDLDERSIEQLASDLQLIGKVGIRPTHMRVTQGRIVRSGWFSWYWVMPQVNGWRYLGPFFFRRGAEKGAREWGCRFLPGWGHLQNLAVYFPYLLEIPHEANPVMQMRSGPALKLIPTVPAKHVGE
jgi:hypothetical protein